MNSLQNGQFYGVTNQTLKLGGLTLTDTEYTHEYVDWHYHENAYFTFILDGRVVESNKKETYHCSPGSLLFHQWDEAHYNVKPKGYTRGFHIELVPEWFDGYGVDTSTLQGSINLNHPHLKVLMYKILKEAKLDTETSSLAIDSLLIELFSQASKAEISLNHHKPLWVTQLKSLLHDNPAHPWTLHELSQQLSIHPVHLSREFAKHFHCNLGTYLRLLKVQRALALLPDREASLTTIALQCGFADQSHFIRSFKALYHTTPLAYRKLLAGRHVNPVLFST